MALASLLSACASNVSPITMSAVVSVESGGNTLAMHDNTTGESFSPSTEGQAADWADYLIARGDSVDLGLSQINSANLASLGVSTRRIFDPCTNLRAGATILGNDYAAATAHFGPGQYALRRALSAYNSGSMFAAPQYVNRILAAAGIPPDPLPEAPIARRIVRRKTIAASATPKPDFTVTRDPGSSVIVINGHP